MDHGPPPKRRQHHHQHRQINPGPGPDIWRVSTALVAFARNGSGLRSVVFFCWLVVEKGEKRWNEGGGQEGWEKGVFFCVLEVSYANNTGFLRSNLCFVHWVCSVPAGLLLQLLCDLVDHFFGHFGGSEHLSDSIGHSKNGPPVGIYL